MTIRLRFILPTIGMLLLVIASAHGAGNLPGFGDSDWQFDYSIMQYQDAIAFCETPSRLPTAREFAEHAQALGAEGILELNEVDPNNVPARYRRVFVINPDGQKDEFYFSEYGYRPPQRLTSHAWFWSSSIRAEFSRDPFFFNAFTGAVQIGYGRNVDFAVRCIARR